MRSTTSEGSLPARRALVGAACATVLALLALSGPGRASGPAPSFCSGHGQVRVVTGGFTSMEAIAAQPRGGFVVVGAWGGRIFVRRFGTDGVRDTGFGTRFLGAVGAQQTVPEAVVIDHHGRIVIAGTSWASPDLTGSDMSVWRLLPSGARDLSFGTNGHARFGDSDVADEAFGVAVDGKDRPVLAGLTVVSGTPDVSEPTVVRFTAHGRPDLTFNQINGSPMSYFQPTGLDDMPGSEVEVQPDGKLLMSTPGGPTDPMRLARIIPGDVAGTGVAALDAGFGSSGNGIAQIASLGSVNNGYGLQNIHFRLQPHGSVLVFGQNADYSNLAVARLTPNGAVDQTYGLPGGIGLQVPGTRSDLKTVDDVVRSHGVTILGTTYRQGGLRPFLARLRRHGGLDRRFGHNGLKLLPAGVEAGSVTITPEGRLLVTDHLSTTMGDEGFVYRFHRDLTRAACR